METFLILMQLRGFPVSLVTSFARVLGGKRAVVGTVWKQGSQHLRSGPLSPRQHAVLPRHLLNKQDYSDEQRRPCLLPMSRYFGGD